MTVYLDNNATTRPLPRVVDAVADALTVHWHNPSSVHRPGQDARARVELSRRSVATLIGARPKQITFTSGGTEAIDLAIRGVLRAHRRAGRSAVVTSAVEHSAVRDLLEAVEEADDVELHRAPIDNRGVVDAEALADLVDERTAVVSIQWANNETGAIQPIERIGRICRERRVPFHCDGTQWVGKMPTDVSDLPIDLLTFAAHKFHGPKGVGALYARRGVPISPTIHGAQESGRRGGTENVPGIAGFGAAAEAARQWLADEQERERLAALRDRFEQAIAERVPGAAINGPTEPGARLWNTTNIGFPGLEAEPLLMLLSERGVCASAGAACSSGSLDPSPVLLAMGVPERIAHGSLRLSLSRETTDDEIDEAVEAVEACAQRLSGSSSAALA